MNTPTCQEFTRHRGPVTCAAGIPNSPFVITSGYDGAVGLFDRHTGCGQLLGYHRHLVNRVTINAAGTLAATASSDYTLILWDLKARRPVRVLRGHSDDVEDFAFVSDALGASVSRDWRVLLWNLATGSIVRVLEGHQKDVLSVCYHDGKLITSGDDRTLRVWDVETGKLLRTWGPFESETDTCGVDLLRNRAVLGCDDGRVRTFDLATGTPVGTVVAHAAGIKKVAVAPTSGDVLSAGYDQRMLIWDGAALTPKVTLEGRPGVWERSLNWSPDGAQVLAGTFDGTVLVWDAADSRCVAELGRQDADDGNACLNEASAWDEREVALVSDDGFVRLARLTPESGEWLARVKPAAGRILMNAVMADQETGLVAAGAHDQKLHLFAKSGTTLANEVEVDLSEGPINSIRVAHQPGYVGDCFVGCYSGAVVRVARDGRIRDRFRLHGNAVKALRLHPRRPLGVSCSADGVLVSWDFDGRPRDRFLGHLGIIDDVDIDPTGECIASTGRDFTLQVYSLDTGRLQHAVVLGRRSPKALLFLDRDTVLVANYWGELLKVTLPDERVERRTIARNGLSSVIRYGRHVVATSYDGGVYLVRPEDLSVVRCLRAMTQRVDGGGDDW